MLSTGPAVHSLVLFATDIAGVTALSHSTNITQPSASLQKMLEQESGWRKITVAPYLRSWVDLKHEYARVFNR